MTVGFTPDKPSPAPSPSPGGFTPDNGGFTPDRSFTPDKQPAPKQAPSGLYSVNPGVNVVGDYLTRWTKFAGGGIREAFRSVVDGLANSFHLGIYDFNKGHHYAPNDPHLDGRAMDVDTINGETVGDKLTPTISSYIGAALQNPNVRVGVPASIYRALPADQRKRAFVDSAGHVHTELAAVMPGQTVAPKGFKPEVSKGFVKDPQASPPGFTSKAPPTTQASNPMDSPGGFTPETGNAPGPIGGIISPAMAHSWLNQVAGHQDLPFILANALQRDNATMPSPRAIVQELQNPNSHVRTAWNMYAHNPAQAMDEYGLGSPAQQRWMEKNRKGYADSPYDKIDRIPFINAILTFGGEQLNPMAWAEGGLAGKGLGMAARIPGLARLGQGSARMAGLGTPLFDLNARGGVEASQWAKGAIDSINAPHQLLHMTSTPEITEQIFDRLPQAAKDEIVRLKQGLKPNPAMAAQHADLQKRAGLLADDMAQVEKQQQRTKILPPERTYNPKKFFPMAHSYDFGPQAELEAELRGGAGAPGTGGPTAQHKVLNDLDESLSSGKLDADHDLAGNYATWRRQRLQRVAFEDAINRAPASVRRDVEASDWQNTQGVPLSQPWQQNINHSVQDTLDSWISENHARYPEGHPERYELAANPQWVRALNLMQSPGKSPALAKSMVAPELWNFLKGNGGLQRYIGDSSYLPGGEGPLSVKLPGSKDEALEIGGDWLRHYTAIMRNMVISNFVFHPAANVAGNDAAARGVYNLGGAQWSIGGYAYNAAKSLATQFGLKRPESFVGSAEEYSHWLDRALVAGGTAHFGSGRYSALGGDYTRVMTSAYKGFKTRLDRTLTKIGDFNRERTFGQKGEEAFAVSLFKDAVQKGKMSDAQAGQVVREALGDYYNFDPKSPWSAFFFFMPWLKGNMKFWANTLVRHPQYVTGVQHAMRNYGMAQSPESYQGSYPVGDFTTYLKGGTPFTPPFVGRDVGHIVQSAGSAVTGDVMGAVEPAQQMMMGRATPATRLASDTITTINAAFSGDVKGPETDWNVIVNPKAPEAVQHHQAAAYFASHMIPVPLFSYAVQDATRKGMSAQDLGQALVTAGGAGYFGSPKMDEFDSRRVAKAKSDYKKAYEKYRYDGFGEDYLQSAWDRYTDRLRDIGLIH